MIPSAPYREIGVYYEKAEDYTAKDELDWAKEDKLDKMIWTRDEIAKALDGIKSYIESYPDLEWSEEDK